jgi:hypothetical protein
MACALCVEAAWAYKQVTGYATNPCKSEAGGFTTADGGCRDNGTGRVWSRNAVSAERGGSMWTFNGGKGYCANLVEGGKDDWRMPTRDEMTLVAAHGAGTYLDAFWVKSGDGGPDTEHDFQKWSSTTYKKGKYTYAYTVALGSGVVSDANWNTNGGSWTDLICVR